MKSIRYTAAACLMAVAAAATAQNLSTEVVVDRTIVPAERAAVRPAGLIPVLVLPPAPSVALDRSYYTALSPVTRSYTRLDPAAGSMAATPSPYRGYADLGYFPMLNLGLAAGYRIVDTDRLRLGIDLMATGEYYKPDNAPGIHNAMQSWTGEAAAGLSWRATDTGRLSARLTLGLRNNGTPFYHHVSTPSGSLSLGWDARAGIVDYSAGIGADVEKTYNTYQYETNLSDQDPQKIFGLSQQRYRVSASASAPLFAGSRAGLDVDADFVHTSGNEVGKGPDDATLGTVGIKPFYSLTMDAFTARIGVKVNLAAGGTGSKVHVAPDLHLQWAPSRVFGVWADVTGGDVMNPLSAVRDLCPYIVFDRAYGRSNVPVAVEGGFNVGPFRGFSVRLYGGYAEANNWLMIDDAIMEPYYGFDIKGWKAGLALGWEWRFIKASVSGEVSPGTRDSSWLRNRDHARYVIDASVEVRPVEPLTLSVSYGCRASRNIFRRDGRELSLGDVNNLNIGASYAFTPAFTVFGRVENLLGHCYMMLPRMMSQKQTGLVGVALKF